MECKASILPPLIHAGPPYRSRQYTARPAPVCHPPKCLANAELVGRRRPEATAGAHFASKNPPEAHRRTITDPFGHDVFGPDDRASDVLVHRLWY